MNFGGREVFCPFKPKLYPPSSFLTYAAFYYFLSRFPEVWYKYIISGIDRLVWTVFHVLFLASYLNTSVYCVTTTFDICIIHLSCSSTTCSNPPGACSTLQKCSLSAQDVGWYSQFSGRLSDHSVHSLLVGFGFWITDAHFIPQTFSPWT